MIHDKTITRRAWCASILKTLAAGGAVTALLPSLASADAAPIAVTVYKDPNCGCCKKWVSHLSANGFAPVAKDRTDMDALKDSLGIPVALRSCHTAVVGKLLIEGHVPAADMKRLIATAPKGVLGLAVPGMPGGSPGMEMGGRSDRYDVVAFSAGGKTHVFATHG
ncbi:MAG: hypothetical protein JWL61_1019 [Gemmatimonadetes bacterium]|jgi:hypothetical protein|nr:hypothetical protein [Gemmatimonadota bacterium]